MTGAQFNAGLSDLLRDWNVTDYGYPERLRAINDTITEAHEELVRIEHYLARTHQTFAVSASASYYDLPDGTGSQPGFNTHIDQGAFFSGASYPLMLLDQRIRIDYQTASAGTPVGYWFSLTTSGITRMHFERSLAASTNLDMDYVTLSPTWSVSGQDPTSDAGAQNIITYSDTGLSTNRDMPYGGAFDHALKYRAATLLLGRNNFKSREDFEPWGHDKFLSALSVKRKGNFSPMRVRPMFGRRRT